MPMLPITSDQTIQNCRNLTLDGSEIFICSYPKSGTTWTQNIVYSLISQGNTAFGHISDFAPFFEVDATWSGNELSEKYQRNHNQLGWRLFNTHLRWDMMPKSENTRYIYLVRNGKDVCTSFFYHLSNQVEGGYTGSFMQFLEEWLAGEIAFGKWTDHLKSWLWSAEVDERILVISYEEMKKDLRGVVRKIAKHCRISIPENKLQSVLPLLSFHYMKGHKSQFQPQSVNWKPGFEFIRKGESGDHKSLFTAKEHKQFDTLVSKEFPFQIPSRAMGLL